MTDDGELDGLDPFDLLDAEAARLDSYFSGLLAVEWAAPSRCAGWSVRDVLAHLASSEEYHHACLDGGVRGLLEDLGARGATDLASANALGIAARRERTTGQLLAEWRAADADTRRRFRARGTGLVDTSIGEYPCRWQAFHVASELATHADDVFVPVTPGERDGRLAWRARFSRFALAEAKPEVGIRLVGGRTRVQGAGIEVEVDDEELVEGVAGRLDNGSRLDPAARALLSTMP